MEDVSEHVVGEVGHADLYRRPADANRPNEELHLVLLSGKDMLDGGAHFRATAIGPQHGLRHWLALRLLLVDVRLQAIVLQPLLVGPGSVGAVGPNRRGGIVLGDDVSELSAVMGTRARHRPSPDEAMRPVDAGMVLVTEHWNGDVMGLRRC